MSIINILDQQTANLIAAGEVVDRPAAVAKELLENAIDAGGTKITVEIKNGGSSLIRVTDNGKGMSPDDVKNCVLRHATSKIKGPEDLEGIATLGFRGEALAAISSVSRFQVISKEPDSDFGVCMSLEGENTLSFDEVGCPDGTTVTVRDIFFNVPARRKFLKKDATETAYITQYVERIAISHPDIALKFIVDSRIKFSTQGNGDLRDAVYSVFGRDFVENLTEINRDAGKVSINGLISLPESSRINRNHQIIFVNNRLVRSRIVSYAVEDAYKSYIMSDRYPAFILFINIDPYLVDINVHPTKLEVRFVDDAVIRENVYFAVKNTLEHRTNVIKEDFEQVQKNYEAQQLKNAFVPFGKDKSNVQQEIQIPKGIPAFEPKENKNVPESLFDFAAAKPMVEGLEGITFKDAIPSSSVRNSAVSYFGSVPIEDVPAKEDHEIVPAVVPKTDIAIIDTVDTQEEKADLSDNDIDKQDENTVSVNRFVKYCGVVFNTYVIAEYEDNMYLIDKHAAHERILYENLKSSFKTKGVQAIIDTRVIELGAAHFACAAENIDELRSCGFDVEVFGDSSLALRGVPAEFSDIDISESEKIFVEMIKDISQGKSAKLTKQEIFDRSLYTVACKAATKAGYPDSEESYVWLINKLFELDNVFCCPHGRPVIVKYTKSQVERMFYRT